MTVFDFSKEEDQREYKPSGPVPAGSVVIVKMEILAPKPEYADYANPMIQVSQSGLKMIYCQFTVTKGTYADVSWRQTITLPYGMQDTNLTENQITACRIGGSLLKSILISTGKSLNVGNLAIFNGLTIPVKVKINNRPIDYEGHTYWKNEIASVILPEDPRHQGIRQAHEYINEGGAVVGKGEPEKKNKGFDYNKIPDSAYGISPSELGPRFPQTDEVPFN